MCAQGGKSRLCAHPEVVRAETGLGCCSPACGVLSAWGARAGVPLAALAGGPAAGTEGLQLRQLEPAKKKKSTGAGSKMLHRGGWSHCGSAGYWLLHGGGHLHVVPGKALLCLRRTFW